MDHVITLSHVGTHSFRIPQISPSACFEDLNEAVIDWNPRLNNTLALCVLISYTNVQLFVI